MTNADRNDRKNKRRFLLILILILSVAITATLIGTIAKYVSTETVSDEAVSAKFGLNIPNTIDLFSDSYINDNEVTIVDADSEGKKIIAPGTSGKYEFEVTGTSEVAYKVSAGITLTYSEVWYGYEPLEFSLDGKNWTNFENFELSLSAALESETMPPNAAYTGTQTIHWRWPFYLDPTSDVKDTAMGRVSASGDLSPKVTMEIIVTAAQVE